MVVALAGDAACAGQDVQAALPVTFLNVPAAHPVHGPPSGPV
jgi:hypothetical protein